MEDQKGTTSVVRSEFLLSEKKKKFLKLEVSVDANLERLKDILCRREEERGKRVAVTGSNYSKDKPISERVSSVSI